MSVIGLPVSSKFFTATRKSIINDCVLLKKNVFCDYASLSSDNSSGPEALLLQLVSDARFPDSIFFY